MTAYAEHVLAHACVATPRAHLYLARLASRWRDKVVVDFAPKTEPDHARIELPGGPCYLSAGPGSLAILVEAGDEDRLADLEWAITARLERLGRPEGLKVNWARG